MTQDNSESPPPPPQSSMRPNFMDETEQPFWSTQPVSKLAQQIPQELNEPKQANIPKEKIPKSPVDIGDRLYWSDLDLKNNPAHMEELCDLLKKHYVQDEDAKFGLYYASQFLTWVLMPSNYIKEWHVGVRAKHNDALVGFIAAIPFKCVIKGKKLNTVEINFLCLNPALRNKYMAPMLIKEITRRVQLRGIFQAVHTAGHLFSKPITQTFYMHRKINIKKLVDVDFYALKPTHTMKIANKLFSIPEKVSTVGFRPMRGKDIVKLHAIYTNTSSVKYSLHTDFSVESLKHELFPNENANSKYEFGKVVYTYVVENADTKEITDFISFYNLPTIILNPVKNNKFIKTAYLHYYGCTKTPLASLIMDAIVSAKQEGFDLFNALTLMDNSVELLSELKFTRGDAILNYYIYNWVCPQLDPKEVGIILQ